MVLDLFFLTLAERNIIFFDYLSRCNYYYLCFAKNITTIQSLTLLCKVKQNPFDSSFFSKIKDKKVTN